MKLKSESEVAQSCPTLSDPMDCSLPGSSVHGFSRQDYWSGVPLPSPRKPPSWCIKSGQLRTFLGRTRGIAESSYGPRGAWKNRPDSRKRVFALVPSAILGCVGGGRRALRRLEKVCIVGLFIIWEKYPKSVLKGATGQLSLWAGECRVVSEIWSDFPPSFVCFSARSPTHWAVIAHFHASWAYYTRKNNPNLENLHVMVIEVLNFFFFF